MINEKRFSLLIILSFFMLGGCSTSPPIHNAIEKGDTQRAEALILAEGNIEERDENGSTVLHCEAEHNSLQIVRLLLDKGFDIEAIDDYGDTPIFDAAYNLHVDIVKLLIASGADINKHNNKGSGPLYAASTYQDPNDFQRQLSLVGILIEAGASPYKIDNDSIYDDEKTARMYRWAGEYHESKANKAKALENYEVAFQSYEDAFTVYEERSKSLRQKAESKEAKGFGSTGGMGQRAVGQLNSAFSIIIEGDESVDGLRISSDLLDGRAKQVSTLVDYCRQKIEVLSR